MGKGPDSLRLARVLSPIVMSNFAVETVAWVPRMLGELGLESLSCKRCDFHQRPLGMDRRSMDPARYVDLVLLHVASADGKDIWRRVW